ncbi:hypothetical protein [Candidatus Nitrososphaera sp. FF02]|uniref:hypothetical protein n=1 Tax=Candidatus Nitrososphaera sp. FF02 TaxID=3398226 RepID=UPI0039E92ECA
MREYLGSVLKHAMQASHPLAIERILVSASRLDDIEHKIAWCSCFDKSDSVAAALVYYQTQKQYLILDPFLTLGRIKAALVWAKSKPTSAKTGIMIVELGLQELYGIEAEQMVELQRTSQHVAIERLQHLMHEFVKRRQNVVSCPSCGSKKTRYVQYTVVFASEAIECLMCQHLWKVRMGAL